jgi:uncharacterized protein YacL
MNIEKLKPTVATTLVCCLGVFFITVLPFFLLNRTLFFTLNSWQLTGIGIGLAIPILIVSFLILTIGRNYTQNEEATPKYVYGSALFANFIMSIVLVICYLISTSLKTYFVSLFCINAFFVFIASIASPGNRKSTNNY